MIKRLPQVATYNMSNHVLYDVIAKHLQHMIALMASKVRLSHRFFVLNWDPCTVLCSYNLLFKLEHILDGD